MSVYEEDMIAAIGYTSSDDLPTINAIQDEYRGSSDTMVWVFGFEVETPVEDPPIIFAVVVVIAIVALVLVFGILRRMR
jgi:hypothetical protein